jgi:hypothetical protein
VHRLDRLNGNIPANLFDFESLTLEASGQIDCPVYFSLGNFVSARHFYGMASRPSELFPSGRLGAQRCAGASHIARSNALNGSCLNQLFNRATCSSRPRSGWSGSIAHARLNASSASFARPVSEGPRPCPTNKWRRWGCRPAPGQRFPMRPVAFQVAHCYSFQGQRNRVLWI